MSGTTKKKINNAKTGTSSSAEMTPGRLRVASSRYSLTSPKLAMDLLVGGQQNDVTLRHTHADGVADGERLTVCWRKRQHMQLLIADRNQIRDVVSLEDRIANNAIGAIRF